MEYPEIKSVKSIAMRTSDDLEELLTVIAPKESDEKRLLMNETFRLMKGIVDSILLRKDMTIVEDILTCVCFLLVRKPKSIGKILHSLRVIALSEVFIQRKKEGDSDGLQQETDAEGA